MEPLDALQEQLVQHMTMQEALMDGTAARCVHIQHGVALLVPLGLCRHRRMRHVHSIAVY